MAGIDYESRIPNNVNLAGDPRLQRANGEGRLHEVRSGDTLWEISDAYLGTPWVWPSVWKSNEEIENPHRIFPGDKLFVSPNEMRKLTDAEAAAMLAGGQAPAALADGLETGAVVPKSYRFPEIDTAGFVASEQLRGAAAIVDSTPAATNPAFIDTSSVSSRDSQGPPTYPKAIASA